jgi:hypothetical protein
MDQERCILYPRGQVPGINDADRSEESNVACAGCQALDVETTYVESHDPD